jgi:hypothetical protein
VWVEGGPLRWKRKEGAHTHTYLTKARSLKDQNAKGNKNTENFTFSSFLWRWFSFRELVHEAGKRRIPFSKSGCVCLPSPHTHTLTSTSCSFFAIVRVGFPLCVHCFGGCGPRGPASRSLGSFRLWEPVPFWHIGGVARPTGACFSLGRCASRLLPLRRGRRPEGPAPLSQSAEGRSFLHV